MQRISKYLQVLFDNENNENKFIKCIHRANCYDKEKFNRCLKFYNKIENNENFLNKHFREILKISNFYENEGILNMFNGISTDNLIFIIKNNLYRIKIDENIGNFEKFLKNIKFNEKPLSEKIKLLKEIKGIYELEWKIFNYEDIKELERIKLLEKYHTQIYFPKNEIVTDEEVIKILCEYKKSDIFNQIELLVSSEEILNEIINSKYSNYFIIYVNDAKIYHKYKNYNNIINLDVTVRLYPYLTKDNVNEWFNNLSEKFFIAEHFNHLTKENKIKLINDYYNSTKYKYLLNRLAEEFNSEIYNLWDDISEEIKSYIVLETIFIKKLSFNDILKLNINKEVLYKLTLDQRTCIKESFNSYNEFKQIIDKME